MGKITIKNLAVFAKHGVLKEERTLGQKFLVSAIIEQNIEKAAKTDNLEYTTDYGQVAKDIERFMQDNTFSLIETATYMLAKNILIKNIHADSVEVIVKKPWAPIGVEIEDVAVSVKCRWHEVYLGIGSNLGDRFENINKAIDILRNDKEVIVERVSKFIETKPVGEVEQGDYINGAIKIKTLKTPSELLELIEDIEQKLKRERTVHWGPRTIDVDILLYDEDAVNTDRLTIPHSQMHLREFVLQPLCSIAPLAKHVLLGKNVFQLYEELKKNEEERL